MERDIDCESCEDFRGKLAELKRSAPICKEHLTSGTRTGCLVCAVQEMSRALSKIGCLAEGSSMKTKTQSKLETVDVKIREAFRDLSRSPNG